MRWRDRKLLNFGRFAPNLALDERVSDACRGIKSFVDLKVSETSRVEEEAEPLNKALDASPFKRLAVSPKSRWAKNYSK